MPVHLPGGRGTLIKDALLAEPAPTAKRTSAILGYYYRRAPHRSDVLDLIPGIEETITGTGRLSDVSEHATITLLRLLNWPEAICRSSGIPARAGRSERLADLTRAVGATTHLCGTGGSGYLDLAPFAALGLGVTMFAPPEHAAGLSLENARRVSVLADLAAAGPERLSAAMREHARLSRDAGMSAGAGSASRSSRALPGSRRDRSGSRGRQPRPAPGSHATRYLHAISRLV
jgi:hypothetical protein